MSDINKKKLSIEDLKVGMYVTIDQLEEIYGVCVVFSDYDDKKGGKIIGITDKEVDFEVQDAVAANNGKAAIFYQPPRYDENGVEIEYIE